MPRARLGDNGIDVDDDDDIVIGDDEDDDINDDDDDANDSAGLSSSSCPARSLHHRCYRWCHRCRHL